MGAWLGAWITLVVWCLSHKDVLSMWAYLCGARMGGECRLVCSGVVTVEMGGCMHTPLPGETVCG